MQVPINVVALQPSRISIRHVPARIEQAPIIITKIDVSGRGIYVLAAHNIPAIGGICPPARIGRINQLRKSQEPSICIQPVPAQLPRGAIPAIGSNQPSLMRFRARLVEVKPARIALCPAMLRFNLYALAARLERAQAISTARIGGICIGNLRSRIGRVGRDAFLLIRGRAVRPRRFILHRRI